MDGISALKRGAYAFLNEDPDAVCRSGGPSFFHICQAASEVPLLATIVRTGGAFQLLYYTSSSDLIEVVFGFDIGNEIAHWLIMCATVCYTCVLGYIESSGSEEPQDVEPPPPT